MKISKIFNLDKSQCELDFVDIDINKDTPLFLDPFLIASRQHRWCFDADRTIKSFFQHAIELIGRGEKEKARDIFVNFNEVNDTCLGMSKGMPDGRGIASDGANELFESIMESRAVKTGLIENLEDAAIFIDGIDKDKISDMTTNIIRKNLLDYTVEQCNLHRIMLIDSIPSGKYWDIATLSWKENYARRLVINEKPILLVPKATVSYYKEYCSRQYSNEFVLEFLQGDHIRRRTYLVQHRKSGAPYVTKKDLKEKEMDADPSKAGLRGFTLKYPMVFQKFKTETGKTIRQLNDKEIDEELNLSEIVGYLIKELQAIKPGADNATTYHSLMVGILELIFSPNLCNPTKESPINDGRKRIDIVYENAATGGFFFKLHNIHKIPSGYIFFECKNYKLEPKNPEFDQLSGRLSINRGKMGFLVFRNYGNKPKAIKRCADLYVDKTELVIPLSDVEIIQMLEMKKSHKDEEIQTLLGNLQRQIIIA